jgi:hypothetical protein
MFKFTSFLLGTLLLSPVFAEEKPNIQAGLWSYTHTTTMEGAINLPPQTTTAEECFTQKSLDKGVDMLNIPKSCTINSIVMTHEQADFDATCLLAGLNANYAGHVNFNGNQLDGRMTSQSQTPLGLMVMKVNFVGKRIASCKG